MDTPTGAVLGGFADSCQPTRRDREGAGAGGQRTRSGCNHHGASLTSHGGARPASRLESRLASARTANCVECTGVPQGGGGDGHGQYVAFTGHRLDAPTVTGWWSW